MLAEEISRAPEGPPLVLLFGCRTEHDILWSDELEAWKANPRFRLEVTLSRPDERWRGRRGYVQAHTAEIATTLGSPGGAGTNVPAHFYVCGLAKMVDEVVALITGPIGRPARVRPLRDVRLIIRVSAMLGTGRGGTEVVAGGRNTDGFTAGFPGEGEAAAALADAGGGGSGCSVATTRTFSAESGCRRVNGRYPARRTAKTRGSRCTLACAMGNVSGVDPSNRSPSMTSAAGGDDSMESKKLVFATAEGAGGGGAAATTAASTRSPGSA